MLDNARWQCEVAQCNNQSINLSINVNQWNVQCSLGLKLICLLISQFFIVSLHVNSINQSNMIYHADNLCACRYVFSGQNKLRFSFREKECVSWTERERIRDRERVARFLSERLRNRSENQTEIGYQNRGQHFTWISSTRYSN